MTEKKAYLILKKEKDLLEIDMDHMFKFLTSSK